MDTIGKRIKHLRNEANLTQSQLGDLLGVKKASIQKYENGSVVNLKTEIVETLAKVFDVSPSYILGWDDEVDVNSLSSEVLFLEEVNRRYGYVGVNLCEMFSKLNEDGMRKVLFYAEDIGGNKKYTV